VELGNNRTGVLSLNFSKRRVPATYEGSPKSLGKRIEAAHQQSENGFYRPAVIQRPFKLLFSNRSI
jgi:hypothetical protein